MDAQFVRTKFEGNQYVGSDIATKNRRFGLLLWRIANGGIFVFFVFANLLMRNSQPQWPPSDAVRPDFVIPTVVTLLLMLSSWPASQALARIRQNDSAGTLRRLELVILLGVIFVAGVLFTMLRLPYSGTYSSIVNAMFGFHMVHAVIGMGLFGYVLNKLRRGAYSGQQYWGVEAAVVFWHFVDLMWIVFYLFIFVI